MLLIILRTVWYVFQGLLSVSDGVFGNALLRTDVTSTSSRADVQLVFSALTESLGDGKVRHYAIFTPVAFI